jgi:hypothetical protein
VAARGDFVGFNLAAGLLPGGLDGLGESEGGGGVVARAADEGGGRALGFAGIGLAGCDGTDTSASGISFSAKVQPEPVWAA